MSKLNIKSYSQLEKVLKEKVEKAMKNEVAKKTKEVVQKNVEDVVYSVGEPTVYERRNLTNGSLGDMEEMKHEYKDGVLEVTNEADYNPKFSSDGINDESLAYNIEYGYGSRDRWYNEPRPFIEESRNDLRNGEFKDSLAEGLTKQGLKVKK